MDIDVYNSESKTIKSFSCPLIENSRYEETYNDNVCRICESNNIQLTPIFKDDGLKNQFEIKINKYLPLKVSENDNLPKSICSLCISTLNSWHDLFETCKKTDKRLKKLRYIQQIQLKQQKNLIDKMHSYGTKILEENPSTSASLQENRITEQSFQQNLDHLSDNCANDVDNYENLIECRDENVDNPIGLTEEESNVSSRPEYKCSHCESSFTFHSQLQNHLALEHDQEDPTLPSSTIIIRLNALQKNQIPSTSNNRRRRKQLVVVKQETSDVESVDFNPMNENEQESSTTTQRTSKRKSVGLEECRECGVQISRFWMPCHLRIHSGEKPFICHICGRQFRVSAQLRRHVREIHEGIKAYECEKCGYRFGNKVACEEHLRTHSDERHYICHICSKGFKTKASLFVHNKFHLNVFPHKCSYCAKSFRRRQQLDQHVRLHTGEKPYTCDTCGKSFRLHQVLKRHISIHKRASTLKHVCEECGEEFAQASQLRSHKQLHLISS